MSNDKASKTLSSKKRLSLTIGLVIGLASITGCSTLSDGVDAAGSGLVSAAESAQRVMTDVKVTKIDTDLYELQSSFSEPVRSLDSWAMRVEAREVCPDGYVYEQRKALSQQAFGVSDEACVGANCTYSLQWRIKCADVPEEPFSFFGKT